MRPKWQAQAACRGKSKIMFSHLPELQNRARALCASCPVLTECKDMGRREPFGVWGGKLASERGYRGSGKTDIPRRKAAEAFDALADWLEQAGWVALTWQ